MQNLNKKTSSKEHCIENFTLYRNNFMLLCFCSSVGRALALKADSCRAGATSQVGQVSTWPLFRSKYA